MDDERDGSHLVGQTAGLIAMMSALVKSLPPSTRKRLLRQTHAEFDSLLAAMATTDAAGAHADREGIEWIRDLFLKRIAEGDSKPKRRKGPSTAGEAKPAAAGKRSSTTEPRSSTGVDFEL